MIEFVDLDKEIVDEINNIFYVKKGEEKFIRFLYGINSFFGLRMHDLSIDGRYKKVYCKGKCEYCNENESKVHIFVPIVECNEFGVVLTNKIKVWDLPFNDIYNYIKGLDSKIIDNLREFYMIIDRKNGYKFRIVHTFSKIDNLKIDDKGFLKNEYGDMISDIYK